MDRWWESTILWRLKEYQFTQWRITRRMTGMAEAYGTQFEYPDLKQVDPEYSKLEADIYTLRVLKLTLSEPTAEAAAAGKKPYVIGQFAVTKHDKHSARRLTKFFNNVLDPGKRDMKDLAKLAKVTGVPFDGGLPQWCAEITTIQPEFKAPVMLEPQFKNVKQGDGSWSKVPELEGNGEPVLDNRIDFRNAQPAN
jgi:hypothetical protein